MICSMCTGTGVYTDEDGITPCPACRCYGCGRETEDRYALCVECDSREVSTAREVEPSAGGYR